MAVLNKVACETMMSSGEGLHRHHRLRAGGHAWAWRAKPRRDASLLGPDPRPPDTRDLLERGSTTGATSANAANVAGRLPFARDVTEPERQLFSTPRRQAGSSSRCVRATPTPSSGACGTGVPAASIVGECVASDDPHLEMIKH
jgi:hypothetical protein